MTGHLFAPTPPATLTVLGSDLKFPVRRVICVGRNYAAHAREMGGDPTRERPFFFMKPGCAVVPGGGRVPYPSATADLHHEVELVAALGEGGRIAAWAVGVDLTRRDLQAEAKAAGRPWDAAKGFDASAPVGALTPIAALAEPSGGLRLSVNGEVRQDGRLSDMIWSPAEVVAKAAELWSLSAGDLIFTGTPEGVGPLRRGDRVEAVVDGLDPLRFEVT